MERRQDLDLAKTKRVLVRGGNADVRVVGEETEKAYALYEVSSDETPDMVQVENEKDRVVLSMSSEGFARPRVRLVLPKAERPVEVETGNGPIVLESLSGEIRAAATNGRVELKDLSGNLNVVCANGSIEAENLDGVLEASTANGRITVKESRLGGGSVKSGNGRIALQVRPGTGGPLSVFAGSGRVELALPEDSDFRIRVKTAGRLHNHLESYSVSTEKETTVVQKGSGDFEILVQNFRGSVRLVKHDDFGKPWEEEGPFPGLESELNEFFEKLSGYFEEIPRNFDFSDEIPKIAQKMRKMGSKFGKMGEEFSRQFHEGQRKQRRPGDRQREVDMILDMLKEGKVSAEEAEKLINAVRGRG